jgi:hypothetical protein
MELQIPILTLISARRAVLRRSGLVLSVLSPRGCRRCVPPMHFFEKYHVTSILPKKTPKLCNNGRFAFDTETPPETTVYDMYKLVINVSYIIVGCKICHLQ